MIKPLITLIAAVSCTASASPRTSKDYSIIAESIDAGGVTLSSTDYSIQASINTSGIPTDETNTRYNAKSGYIGQLFDVIGIIPTAASWLINEGDIVQLGVAQVLDDATLLPFPPSLATWEVANGPLSGIDASGLASAGHVYEDTPASVCATYQGKTGTLSLCVLNTNTDDYDTYAEDGLPDEWQMRYFGENNPNAAPDKDTTGSGQTNLFKYTAGLDPTDPSAIFRVIVQPVVKQPSQEQIVFGPIISGRTYTVFFKNDLSEATWTPLADAEQYDKDQQRTVIDTHAVGKAKFYRIQISNP